MLKIIVGPAGSGKTIQLHDCLLKEKTSDNIIIVAPQSVLAYEKFLAKNSVRGKIISIDDIAALYDVAEIAIKEITTTTDSLSVISEIIRDQQLNLTKPSNASSGVITRVKGAISDLKKEGIDPKTLDNWIESSKFGGILYKKTKDISLIMKEFDKKLKEKGMTTKEDAESYFIELMEQSPRVLCNNLFIDTLSAYPQNVVRLIKTLIKASSNTYITFRSTSAKQTDYFAFEDSVKAIQSLKETFPDYREIKASRKTVTAAMRDVANGIDLVATHFFDRKPTISSNSSAVALHEASTPISEVEYIASEIKKLQSSGVKLDDILIASAVIEDYFPIIQDTFSASNIPFHYFKNENLDGTQLFDMVKVMIDSITDGINLSRIEKIVQHNYQGFTETDIALFDGFVKRFGDDINIAISNCELYDPSNVDKIKEIIEVATESIESLRYSIGSDTHVDNYLKNIVETLIAYNINESMYIDVENLYKGNEYQKCTNVITVWNSFIEVVNSMYKFYEHTEMRLDEFMKIFEKLCSEKKLVNNVKYFDTVSIVSLPDVVNNRSKYLFVCGCNEGTLISVPEETYFDKTEKEILNNKLSLDIPNESYFIAKKIADVYSAFTTPYDKLIISWPDYDLSYSPVSCAELLRSIKTIFKNNITKEAEYVSTEGESDFVSLLCKISECYHLGTKLDPNTVSKINYYKHSPDYKDRLNRALHEMVLDRSKINLTNFTPPPISKLAVTTAEKYNECPFKYFVSSVFSPKEQKMFIETSANKGTFYHQVFCNFYNYVVSNKIDIEILLKDKTKFDVILSDIMIEIQKSHNENILNSNAKFAFVSKKMRETANISVWNSLKQISAGKFKPTWFEHNIGDCSNLKVKTKDGQIVSIAGIADRIDTYEDGDTKYARIIDYKSGNVTFDTEKAEKGIQMQLPLYMKSLTDYKAAGMYYFHVSLPFSNIDDREETLKEFKLSGPTASYGKIPEASDSILSTVGCSVSSDIINCSKTAKGEYSKRSNIYTSEEMNKIMDKATEQFLRAANGIISRETVADPVILPTFSACTYCNYSSMCGKAKPLKT